MEYLRPKAAIASSTAVSTSLPQRPSQLSLRNPMFESDEISQSCCPLRERLTTLLHTPSLEETGVGAVLFDISGFALLCREGANWDRVQAVMRAIDDYAEAATGNREYFWDRPVGIG
jgi:hypothetical protein